MADSSSPVPESGLTTAERVISQLTGIVGPDTDLIAAAIAAAYQRGSDEAREDGAKASPAPMDELK